MFDYIIIGAGSAGCVLANRLSQDPANQVLLLEAGPKDNNPMIHMPGGCAEVLKSDKLNWKFESTPQKNLGGRRFEVHRGRTLGGSSSANGMVYIRGHASDYDDWAAAGNSGWSYNEVLPYFKRFEDQVRGADDYHGVGGELYVRNGPSDNPLFKNYIAAGVEIGIPANDDFNGAEQEGIGRFQSTIKNGKRWSSSVAFLKPVMDRPNLTVICDANVDAIVLEGKRATGVKCTIKKKTQQFAAGKEVILSAGAIKSPHILQLSGIGDPQDLNKAGISCKHELPGVGKNLQEHLDVIMRYAINQPLSMNGIDRFPRNVAVAWNYFVHKKGVATYNNIEAGGFVKSSPELDRPDIQLHFVPCNLPTLTDPLPAQHGVTVHACQLRPHSRGTVMATSADPQAKPEIDFNFLDDQRDAAELIKCFRLLRKMMTAKAWDGLLEGELAPGPQIESDDEILAALGENTETVYHPVGTCKMGSDKLAVVDAQLRVHGIDGLRVADASIMPNIIGGNTNAPAMMIGDKCADMVLASQG